MKRLVVVTLALGFLVGASALTFAANDELDFTLVNKTGVELAAVFISPSHKDDWGDNVISKPLATDYQIAITFPPKAKSALWDIRIEDAAGNFKYWTGLDLTVINTLTLDYDAATDKATATWK
jgi:hypothetical protein